MIRSLYRSHNGQVYTDLKPDKLTTALQDINGTLWVDFVSESSEVCEPILRETFSFHPLAIEDALQESHSPKVDDWDDYLSDWDYRMKILINGYTGTETLINFPALIRFHPGLSRMGVGGRLV